MDGDDDRSAPGDPISAAVVVDAAGDRVYPVQQGPVDPGPTPLLGGYFIHGGSDVATTRPGHTPESYVGRLSILSMT